MISKLIIVDTDLTDEVNSLLETIKSNDSLIVHYNYRGGFIVNNENLFVKEIITLIRSYLETTTINLEYLCFMNFHQMKTPVHSNIYNGDLHIISNIENKPESLESWNFMSKLVSDIRKNTEIHNIDFIDIDHLCFPKEYGIIFEKIQELTNSVRDCEINYLKIQQEDKDAIYNSNNWLYTLFTTFYSGENKVILDKYFKVNNKNIRIIGDKTMKPYDLRIYDKSTMIDFKRGKLNICIIPLYGYSSNMDYDIMSKFVNGLKNNSVIEFVYPMDTNLEFTERLISNINKYCNENKSKICELNMCLWMNPNVSNSLLKMSNNIDANIDETLITVINELKTNNNENIAMLKNHFVVKLFENIIEYFHLNIFENQIIKKIDFEIFNISELYNTNYNIFCQFLHNDYYVSNLVNFNLTFLSYADISDNLFELSISGEETDSLSVFKDSWLIQDISNNLAFQDQYIFSTSHRNKSISYNIDINLDNYLADDLDEAETLMKSNMISNVILYDMELSQHLSDVRSCILPNTLLLTFNKQNTYQEIKNGLLEMNKLNGVQITNVALFQDNDSKSKTYNFVNEETCIVKYTPRHDPSLNTWSKFQDFVTFLDTEMNVKYLDLLMCKIYSNSNWKYVIDTISSNLTSLEIRSSENNTGHTMFQGDWILESPVVDVNMINLYFKESIKKLNIQLGTTAYPEDYTKVGSMNTYTRWVENRSSPWGENGPMFAVRFPVTATGVYDAYTLNFDNNTNVLIPPTGNINSYNYSDTITAERGFNQKTHSESPGNLYIAFDDESDVDENTWFIPVTGIWNGMNHDIANITVFSHTDYWDTTDIASYEALFEETFTSDNFGLPVTDMSAVDGPAVATGYFYVGPYTAYSGISNPPRAVVHEYSKICSAIYDYNTGLDLSSSDSSGVTIHKLTEDSTIYVNYDISATIKEYVAHSYPTPVFSFDMGTDGGIIAGGSEIGNLDVQSTTSPGPLAVQGPDGGMSGILFTAHHRITAAAADGKGIRIGPEWTIDCYMNRTNSTTAWHTLLGSEGRGYRHLVMRHFFGAVKDGEGFVFAQKDKRNVNPGSLPGAGHDLTTAELEAHIHNDWYRFTISADTNGIYYYTCGIDDSIASTASNPIAQDADMHTFGNTPNGNGYSHAESFGYLYGFRLYDKKYLPSEIEDPYSQSSESEQSSLSDVLSQSVNLDAGVYNVIVDNSSTDVSAEIVVDLSENSITSNVSFFIEHTSYDISLSTLTNNLSILPSKPQTIPFVKSVGNQEERNVTLYGGATYNRFSNEYYFPGHLSGYASIGGQLFGESAMSMSFMYKSGGTQTNFSGTPSRNTIVYIGQNAQSAHNQNSYDTNDFAIYSSQNDQASIFYKESATSITDISSEIFDNSSNYTHIVITMNEDLTLSETDGFKMYVNGLLKKSGNLSDNSGALISGVAQPLQLLGKGPLPSGGDSSAFKGYLKNIRFYDKVLSQSEITGIFTNMMTNGYIDNYNYVTHPIPNVVISSSDINSGEHTELTSISMEITYDTSLNITADDINVVNGTISEFTNNTTNTWSFTFTPTNLNEKSSLTISENSLFNNTINNMTDRPSWFDVSSNYKSNVFEFIANDVSFDLIPPLQDQTIAMITSTGSHIEIPVTLDGNTQSSFTQSIASITANNSSVNIPDATSLDDIDISEAYIYGTHQPAPRLTGIYKVPDEYKWIVYYNESDTNSPKWLKMIEVEAVESNGTFGIQTLGQGYRGLAEHSEVNNINVYNEIPSGQRVPATGYGLTYITLNITNTNYAVTYDASKNEYDLSENGYLSVSDEMIRGGDLTISMMYAMKSGNEYGNDQLVNFSDSNSFNRASDSTDLHIFRDGTTPGAWLYYGASGMAISEAGLQPALENIAEQFDTTDLQIEYIVDSQYITNLEWRSVYTLDEYGNDTPSTAIIPSTWSSSSDEDGNYLRINTDASAMDIPYPNETTYVMNMDEHDKTTTAKGFTYEIWVKLPEGESIGGDGWVLGLETGWGPCLVLDARGTRHPWGLGGIGMTPYTKDKNTYDGGSPGPGYISDQPGKLLHIVGYMYRDPTSTAAPDAMPFFRGVYVNGIHYAQTTTQQEENQTHLPVFDGVNNNIHLRIGHNTSNHAVTNSDGLQIYSFRVWHRQLTDAEVAQLYSWGPHGSVISPPEVSIQKYTHMAVTMSKTEPEKFYINGEKVQYVAKYSSSNNPITEHISGGKRQYQFFGYGYAANRGFNGLIKNIRFYNKILSDSEIRHLYLVNSKFNDNEFSDTPRISISRPTLTFTASEPKIFDSDNNEYNHTTFTENGTEYKSYSFTNTGTTSITLDRNVTNVEILIVGGGGAGGFWVGGGGGGGGVVYAVNQSLSAGTYDIEVGAGGVGWKQGGGVVPTNIGGDGIYQSQSGLDSSIKQSSTPISLTLVNNTEDAIGHGGGGGGNMTSSIFTNIVSPGNPEGVNGGSGGGSSGPWRHSSDHEVYEGGDATQGDTLYDISSQTYIAGGHNGNTLIGDDLQETDFKPAMGMGGGGASSLIHNDDYAENGWLHVNGKDGIDITIGGTTHTLAAGGGGSQLGYHKLWHGDPPSYNTDVSHGLGGSDGVGGHGMLWTGPGGNALSGTPSRTASNGAANTGSGGGGATGFDNFPNGSIEKSGSGGSGIVIIQFPSGVIYSGDSVEQKTLDLTLTASDDDLSGNIDASDIIVTNGSISSFLQTSPTTWDLTYTSDYKEQSNASSVFIEHDTIYNNDVSDLFATPPPATFKYVVFQRVEVPGAGAGTGYTVGSCFESAIGEISCILNNNTNVCYRGEREDDGDALNPPQHLRPVRGEGDNHPSLGPSPTPSTGVYEDLTINSNNDVSWSKLNQFVAGWTRGDFGIDKALDGLVPINNTSYNPYKIDPPSPLSFDTTNTDTRFLHINNANQKKCSVVIELLDSQLVSDISFLYVADHSSRYPGRISGHRFILLDADKRVVAETEKIPDDRPEVPNGGNALAASNQHIIYNYSDITLVGNSFTPPAWWTREHNKASNKFEWTALNSGDLPPSGEEESDSSTEEESDSSTPSTPTRPIVTISSADLSNGDSQTFGTVSMSIDVSSENLNIVEADLSFTNGVISNFTNISNNNYTFNFTSTEPFKRSSVEILRDTVYNIESLNRFNLASGPFDWTWNYDISANPPSVNIDSIDSDVSGQEVSMILELIDYDLCGNSVSLTFSPDDVSATNGYIFNNITEISQNKITFSAGSTSTFNQATTIFLPENVITLTFNGVYTVVSNLESNKFSWTYDSQPLTIESTTVSNLHDSVINDNGYVNNNELSAQFTFSESIYNFNADYFTKSNCKINRILSNTAFTIFTVKMETFYPSRASIAVKSNKLVTTGRGLQKPIIAGGNSLFTWNYDNTRPEISMTSSQETGLTNDVSFVDLSFSSTISTSNFTESSITVTGDASLSNFTKNSETEYSVRVAPNNPDTTTNINVSVNVDAYTDQYGNGNENSVSFDWTYDNVPPTVSLFSPDVANGADSSDSYINIYFTTSKPVNNFVLSDINVTNGTLGALTKTNVFVNHDNYFRVTVAAKTGSHPYPYTGSERGYFITGVESPALDFIVGKTYIFDQSDLTNDGHPLRFYLDDNKTSEYTTNVTSSGTPGTDDATVSIVIDGNTPSTLYYQCENHSLMGYKAEISNNESYVAKLYPTQTNKTVSVYVLANSITDHAGNTNASDSSTFSWGFNSDDLLATLSSSDVSNDGSFTNDAVNISLETSDDISGFVASDISCENGTISNVDATAKTFTVTSDAQGVPTSVFIIGGAIETAQREGNIESNTFTWTYNPPIPNLTISSSQINAGDYTNVSPIDFTLTFDQATVVFDASDLIVTNGTITPFSFSGSGTTYQVSVTPTTVHGALSLSLPENRAYVVDNGEHYNDISYNFDWNYDSVSPTITIGSTFVEEDLSSTLTSINLTVESSEHIDGLNISDFDISNAVISALSDSSGTSFTLTIKQLDDTVDASINICLPADSVVDRANNSNTKSNEFSYSYIYVSKILETTAIAELFEADIEIPENEKLSSTEIDLVISVAYTIPDTSSSSTEFTVPDSVQIKNSKVFTRLIDQIFANTSENVTSLTIDKSSMAVASAAEDEIADVEKVVMVKSNQTTPVDMSALIEDPTKASATYIPLANLGDFAIVNIGGVLYRTDVVGDGEFILSTAPPYLELGTFNSNDIYRVDELNKIIFGSQIISTSPAISGPPTLTISTSQVSSGGTTDASYIDLSFVFSTTVEISLNDIEALNANTTIISRTIVTDGSDSHIAVTVAPVDLCDNIIGVFVDVSAFYNSDNTFNDVSYTYSWNFSLDGGGDGTIFIPCFLEGTKILTTKGYKNIELLNPKKDKLLNKDNKVLNFLDIQKYSQDNNGQQYPYKIPNGSELSKDYICIQDLYLTHNHCVYLPHLNKYAPVSAMKHLKEDKTLAQKKFTYYHVFTEDYFSDTLMANGIPCETHGKYTFAKLRNIDPTNKLLMNVIKTTKMMPNCMRDHLSVKEMKQIIKKFKTKQNKKKKIKVRR